LLSQARYHQTAGRSSQAYAAAAEVLARDPANPAAMQLRDQLLAADPGLAASAVPPANAAVPVPDAAPAPPPASEIEAPAAAVVPPAVPQTRPEPAPAAADTGGPIEPPSFWQFEDDVSFRERPRHLEYGIEPERLSILDATPLPAEPGNPARTVGAIASGVAVAVSLATLFGGHAGKNSVNRFSPPVAVQGSAADERVYRVGGGVTAPVLFSKEDPEYTEEARQSNVQGTVTLYAHIDPSGNAVNLRVLRGLGMGLDARAIEAVSRWRFQPGMKNGVPVTVEATVEVNFRLNSMGVPIGQSGPNRQGW
jgi:TonB family protein